MRSSLLLGLVGLGVLFLSACAIADGTVSGGQDLFDASAPTPPPVEGGADAGTDAVTAGDSGAGADTWTALYHDYFGTTGVASCAGTGTCHGSASQSGAQTSQYICPPGDQTGCYTGITNPMAGLLTPGDGKAFSTTVLYSILRKQSGGGNMPKSGYSFTAADIARISSWVAAGAKND